jgi:hypothetical protein
MLTKHIALLVAGTLMFSACQSASDDAEVATGSAQGTLSGITHEPMGEARIREQGGQLFATNMHSTADGVRSLYQPGVHWGAALDWADDVSAIRLNSINSRLSGEDTTSSLALDRVGENEWEIGADFVSPNYRINVYDGDKLVGTVRPDPERPVKIHTTIIIIVYVDFDVIVIIVYDEQGAATTTQECSWTLSSPQGIEIAQGDTVLRGDRIEIIEDPHESYGGFDEIQVLGNGDVTYLSEEVTLE